MIYERRGFGGANKANKWLLIFLCNAFVCFAEERSVSRIEKGWVQTTRPTVLRERSSPKSKAIADVDANTLVQVLSQSPKGLWLQVQDEDGIQGWIPTKSTNHDAQVWAKQKQATTPALSAPSGESSSLSSKRRLGKPDSLEPMPQVEDSHNDESFEHAQKIQSRRLLHGLAFEVGVFKSRSSHETLMNKIFSYSLWSASQSVEFSSRGGSAVEFRRMGIWAAYVWSRSKDVAFGFALQSGAGSWIWGPELGFIFGTPQSPWLGYLLGRRLGTSANLFVKLGSGFRYGMEPEGRIGLQWLL